MENKLKHALGLRFTPVLNQLAGNIASDLHQTLELEVARQLAAKVTNDAGISTYGVRLGDFTRRWHHLAKAAKWLTIGNVFVCVFASVDFRLNPYARIGLLSSSAVSILVAKQFHQAANNSLAIASMLARIEAAESAARLVQVVKPISGISQPVVTVQSEAMPVKAQPVKEIPLFDLEAVLEEATGIALLGNSGSAKTSIAKFIAGGVGSSQILILDSHDDPTETNWDGLTVIREYEKIAEQLELLLKLLDNHDKTPLVIICDEWPAVRAWCKQRELDIADRFLLRYGSEARKYKKLPIFCSQAGNTKALGLEGMGDFLENFMLIRLQKVAIKYARNLPDQSVLQHCKSVAYACLISDEPVIHPTHGHHPRAYKGAPPKGLKPLQSLPLTIPLATGSKEQ